MQPISPEKLVLGKFYVFEMARRYEVPYVRGRFVKKTDDGRIKLTNVKLFKSSSDAFNNKASKFKANFIFLPWDLIISPFGKDENDDEDEDELSDLISKTSLGGKRRKTKARKSMKKSRTTRRRYNY